MRNAFIYNTIDQGKQMATRHLSILLQAYKALFMTHCFLFLLTFLLLLGYFMPNSTLIDAFYYVVASGFNLLSLEHVFNISSDGGVIKWSVKSLITSTDYLNQTVDFFNYVIYGAKHSLDLSSMIILFLLIEKLTRSRRNAKKT